MAALQDFLRKNLASTYGGTFGKGLLVFDAANIVTADNKIKSIFRTARDIALFRILWPATVLQALTGLNTAFRHLAIDTGSLEAALERIRTISIYTGQFEPLLKGAAAAKQRVAELIQFAAKSPFSLDAIVQASRALEIFTRGAMGSVKSLQLVQNMARASGTSLETATEAFGNLYRSLENHEPISKASQEIQRMGLLSEQTASKIQRMQDTGATFAQVWLTVQEALKVNSKQSDNYSRSLEGLVKQLETAKEEGKAAFGKAFIPAQTKGVELGLGTAKNVKPILETLGNTLASVTGAGQNLSAQVANWVTSFRPLAAIIGTVAKAFVLLTEAVAGFVAFKGLQAGLEAFKVVGDAASGLTKTAIAARLSTQSINMFAKAADASAAGAAMSARYYNFLGNTLRSTSSTVANFTISFKGLLSAVVRNPFSWLTAAAAGAAVMWQAKEATDAAAKSLQALSDANSESLKKSTDGIRAIQTQEDAYTQMANAIEMATDAQKKLKDLGPVEAPGVIEKLTTGPLATLATGGIEDIFGFRDRRLARNAERESTEQQGNLAKRRTELLAERSRQAQFLPGKETEAVLETAAVRQVRLDQMMRENKINLATGQEKIRLMREEQAIEEDKGARGEAAAKERARIEGVTRGIALEGQSKGYSQERIQRQMAAARLKSTSDIIVQEQKVSEMRRAPGEDPAAFARRYEQAYLAVQVTKVDLENNREAHMERGLGLRATIQQADLEERLAEIRLTSEERIAQLKTVGVERARQEYAIKMATLEATARAQMAAGHPEAVRAAQAEMQLTRQEEYERERGVQVTRAQFQIEMEQHAARRAGRTDESQRLEDIGAFLGHFEELKGTFGEPEAAKMAIEKRHDELLEAQQSVGTVVADSLTAIGAGGGVTGVTGESTQHIQDRIRKLTEDSVRLLGEIDKNTEVKTAEATPAVVEEKPGAPPPPPPSPTKMESETVGTTGRPMPLKMESTTVGTVTVPAAPIPPPATTAPPSAPPLIEALPVPEVSVTNEAPEAPEVNVTTPEVPPPPAEAPSPSPIRPSPIPAETPPGVPPSTFSLLRPSSWRTQPPMPAEAAAPPPPPPPPAPAPAAPAAPAPPETAGAFAFFNPSRWRFQPPATEAPKGPTTLTGLGVGRQAEIVVPGGPPIPPSISITQPPVAEREPVAAGAAPAPAAPKAAAVPTGPTKPGEVDLMGEGLNYLKAIASNTFHLTTPAPPAAAGAPTPTGAAGVGAPAEAAKTEAAKAAVEKIYGKPEVEGFAKVTPAPVVRAIGSRKAELDALEAKSRALASLPAIKGRAGPAVALAGRTEELEGELEKLQATQEAPPGPRPAGVGTVLAPAIASLAPAISEEFPTGPNFYGMKVLRTLMNIHDSHVQSNDYLETMASQGTGVQ